MAAKKPRKLKDRITIWSHQEAALQLSMDYLEKTNGAGGAALINIPTGGGKTAVIALAAHDTTTRKRMLVLAPRLPIRDQLAAEISGKRKKGFFQKKGIAESDLTRQVYRLDNKSDIDKQIKAKPESAIFVSSMHLIDRLYSKDRKAFSKLAKIVDAVVFDEGHYEPASSWSTTIRAFGRPTLIFTATPYRNDLKEFNIDPSHIHVTRYADLVGSRLRKVKVVQAKPFDHPEKFVEEILKQYKMFYGSRPSTAKKLIIRCESSEDIEAIAAAVQRRNLGLIALHEKFGGRTAIAAPWKQRKPPDPEEVNAPEVWIHQHKLLEGVDSSSFCAVAMYKTIGSGRALVQQVGRTVRKASESDTTEALLIDTSGKRISRQWERFCEYDKLQTVSGLTKSASSIVKEVIEAAPVYDYISGGFRERFGANANIDIREDIIVPTSTTFLQVGSKFSVASFGKMISEELGERAVQYSQYDAGKDRLAFLYITWRNSPFLSAHYFVELKLNVILAAKLSDDCICFLDTGGGHKQRGDDEDILGPVLSSSVSKLINIGKASRITSVDSRNSSLAANAIRARTIRAASLQETAPFIDDFQYSAVSIRGLFDGAWRPADRQALIVSAAMQQGRKPPKSRNFRRHVSLARGQVSEDGRMVTVPDYFEWAKAAYDEMSKTGAPNQVLQRYAKIAKSLPTKPDAKNILLHLDDVLSDYVYYPTPNGPGVPADFDNLCSDYQLSSGAKRKFVISGNAAKWELDVTFNMARRRYEIEAPALDAHYKYEGDGAPIGLVAYLNRYQAFSIIPDSTSYVYSEGTFLMPGMLFGAAFDADAFQVGKVLIEKADLAGISSEKGDMAALKATAAGWHKDTLFHWIDTNVETILGATPRLMVCDDMGTETSDFIALSNDGQKVVVIHAKANKKGSKYSATSLQTVTAQALKNLGVFNLFNTQKPENVGHWHEEWTSNSVAGSVSTRIRFGGVVKSSAGSEQYWETLKAAIQDPNVEREVWIVLGNTLSKTRLLKELSKTPPTAEAIQLAHLLQATLASVGGANARLKVFCDT